MKKKFFHLHLVSDSTGETLLTLSRAAAARYEEYQPIEHVYPLVQKDLQVDRVAKELKNAPGIVIYAIVNENIQLKLKDICHSLSLPCINALSEITETFDAYLNIDDYVSVPDLPSQELGPLFRFASGRLELVPVSDLDEFGNDTSVLLEIRPELQKIIEDMIESLSSGNFSNIPHSHIYNICDSYYNEIQKELDGISLVKIYSYGLRIQNAVNANERDIVDRELPEFTSKQRETIDSFISLHGVFVLASAKGRALIEAADRYTRSPDDTQALTAIAKEFGQLLVDRTDIAEPKTAKVVKEITDAMDVEDASNRTVQFGASTVRNAIVVLTATAVVGTATTVATGGGYLAVLLAGMAGLIAVESTKKTKVFKSVTETIASGVDKINEMDPQNFDKFRKRAFRPVSKFLAGNASLLRRYATLEKQPWLARALNWLEKNSKSSDE